MAKSLIAKLGPQKMKDLRELAAPSNTDAPTRTQAQKILAVLQAQEKRAAAKPRPAAKPPARKPQPASAMSLEETLAFAERNNLTRTVSHVSRPKPNVLRFGTRQEGRESC